MSPAGSTKWLALGTSLSLHQKPCAMLNAQCGCSQPMPFHGSQFLSTGDPIPNRVCMLREESPSFLDLPFAALMDLPIGRSNWMCRLRRAHELRLALGSCSSLSLGFVSGRGGTFGAWSPCRVLEGVSLKMVGKGSRLVKFGAYILL